MMIVKLTYAVSLLKQFKGAIFFCFFQRKLKILNLLLSQSAFQQWKKEVSLFNILLDVLVYRYLQLLLFTCRLETFKNKMVTKPLV